MYSQLEFKIVAMRIIASLSTLFIKMAEVKQGFSEIWRDHHALLNKVNKSLKDSRLYLKKLPLWIKNKYDMHKKKEKELQIYDLER